MKVPSLAAHAASSNFAVSLLPGQRRLGAWARAMILLLSSVIALAPGGFAQTSSTPPVSDNRAPSLFSVDYVRELWSDTTGVLTEPARWDAGDWQTAGVWTGVTVVTSAFDRRIRQETQAHLRSRSEDRFFKQWQNLGAQYSFVVIAAFEGYGLAADNRNAETTAMDAISASIISSGIVTPVLKYAVGRDRPSDATTPFHFRPFGGHQSFPSGHATQAFAVAAVIAGHYQAPWQQALAYGAAALVDVARIQQNQHWASDVVAGSAIGWAVGRAVVHRHQLPGGFTVQPWIGDGGGLIVARTF